MQNHSLSKAKISELAKLKQKKWRQSEGKLIAEGSRLIEQLFSYGVKPLELYYSAGSRPPYGDLPAYEVDETVMKRLCDSEHPPQISGLYHLPKERLSKRFHTALYLEDISDPGNLGTIFRTAEAFGIEQIFLSPNSCEIANPKVVRSSLGAVYKVPYIYLELNEAFRLKVNHIAVDIGSDTALDQLNESALPAIFYFGNEAKGLSKEAKAFIQESIYIPMRGKMESLNLAVSAAILSYHLSLFKL